MAPAGTEGAVVIATSQLLDAVLAAYFGTIEEEVRFGRPEIGPQIKVRVPEDVLAQIDARAATTELSRSAWVRRAIESALR